MTATASPASPSPRPSSNKKARNAVIAAALGWTLDAFDFFILIMTLDEVAKTFGVSITSVSFAITLTLATRALGAFLFGRLADRFGRKPILVLVILIYSVLEALSGLAWSFTSFIVLRTLFGIAMGGEWGIGASLAMESIPDRWRGWVSGVLQSGYPLGFFLANLLYFVGADTLGWRGMYLVGALPALLALFVVFGVEETPAFRALQKKEAKISTFTILRRNTRLVIYGVLMMAAFNFFSHGTQDLYIKGFLGQQLGFSGEQMANTGMIFNAGAILGGLLFGYLSQHIGRRYSIIAACVLALLALWPWSHGESFVVIALSAFVMQLGVQGAWGVIPAHLNELAPAQIRGTLPGFLYQLGNFVASINAPIQTWLAASHGGDYSYALALTAGIVAVVLILLMLFGPEAYNASMTEATSEPESS